MPGRMTGMTFVEFDAARVSPWADRTAMICVALLLATGLVMVASASLEIDARPGGQSSYYLLRHAAHMFAGILCACALYFTPPEAVFRHGGRLMLLSFFLLVLVFVPEVGRTANGSSRWLNFGVFTLQPSEFARLFIVIYVAGYIARHGRRMHRGAMGFLKPMMLVGVAAVLLLLEPDYGTTAIMIATVLGMLFLTGIHLRHLLGFALVVTCILALFVVFSSYSMQRIISFPDPWGDPTGSGYQLTQSLIAIGSGGWTGVGLGESMQKLFYLPEAHTDFIFSIIAEEFGFIGVCFIVGLFWLLLQRCFVIGRRAQLEELVAEAYFAYGIGIWLGLQSFVNMAVAMGLLPTKGITLPFVSAGGSSLVVSLAAVGMLMRIHYETQQRVPALQYRRVGGGGRER